jgi:hypothetical protein
MGKNQSASNLTNIIKQDANGNISFVSGSTTLMSVSSSGAIETTGNVAGTASYASNAELLDGLDSTVFTLTSSFAAQTASFTAFTASQNILNGTYATTGSNTFTGIQTVNSNLIVTGSITAQTLVVQTVTSSVVYSSGSNVFGNNIANTQTFTGSVNITGSTNLVGALKTNKIGVNTGNVNLDNTSLSLIVSGSIGFAVGEGTAALVNRDGSGNTTFYGGTGDIKFTDVTMTSNYLTIKNAGNVGIGTASPTGTYGKLTVAGGIQITNDNNAKLEIGRYSSGAPNSYIKIGSGSDSLRITNAADSADLFTIANGGNVGIGITNPATSYGFSRSLVISHPTNSEISLEATTSGKVLSMGVTNGLNYFQTTAGNGYDFQIGGTSRFVISSTGAINTSSTLSVGGNASMARFYANCAFSSYTNDGLFNANSLYCSISTPGTSDRIRFGYNDYGGGQYYGRIGFAAPTNWSLGIIGSVGNDFSIGVGFQGSQLYIYANGNYAFSGSNVSDRRKKANINYITTNQLDTILKLKPVTFNKISDEVVSENVHTGFIAQDIMEEGIPNLVMGSDEGGYGLDYEGVLALTVKAIQELKAENDTLKEILQRNNIQ